ncbi:MAG TPA: amidase, partial [Candidatus Dormibacteraeota bacterium]|nr:amidase [Candidatus Dormibacteraeota bacterium]
MTTNQASGEQIAWMSAAELGRRIRRRELSALEVLEATIERIEKRNPSINAFVYKGFEDARKAA